MKVKTIMKAKVKGTKKGGEKERDEKPRGKKRELKQLEPRGHMTSP
jgi:hypothetical protein